MLLLDVGLRRSYDVPYGVVVPPNLNTRDEVVAEVALTVIVDHCLRIEHRKYEIRKKD